MRAVVPSYHMEAPGSLSAALEQLRAEPGRWTPFAGGTDLMVVYEKGQLPKGDYLSLHRCTELRPIEVDATHVTIGALATYADVRDHAIIGQEFPMMVEAARESGAIAIQNRGTIGGNIMNASPAADTPPALLAYGAEVELRSAVATRWVPYRDFHVDYRKTVATADELLTRVRIPRNAAGFSRLHFYEKVGTRAFQAISKVCFAACVDLDDGTIARVGLGLGSVGPTVMRPGHLIAALEGQPLSALPSLRDAAIEAMGKDITPIDDIRSTATYRLRVAQNLAADLVHRIKRFAESR